MLMLEEAEKALEGERIKIPDEVSDEVCDVCGRRMVIKAGRFGRFLACPGYPECNFTKPLVVEMPGKCPRCGSRILKRTSKNGYTYYACEKLKECGFMTWDVPTKDNCPECGQTLFKKSGRGYRKPFCINEKCPNFVPEDQRGYRRKTENPAQAAPQPDAAAEAAAAPEPAPAAGEEGEAKGGRKKRSGRSKAAAKETAEEKAPSERETAAMRS